MKTFISVSLFIAAFIVFIFLQVYICKNAKNKKLGLILPVGSFILAILPFISIILMIIISLIPNKNTNVLYVSSPNIFIPGILIQLLNIIILTIILFIPSIIFTLIYLHYKKISNKNIL